MTHSRPKIRDLLESASLSPRRDLGQNFVADPNTVRKIADLAGVGPGDRVVEIGAGLGSLTLALAETGASVTAIEVDPALVTLLRDVVSDVAGVTVVEADAMRLDWTTLLGADIGHGTDVGATTAAGTGIGTGIGEDGGTHSDGQRGWVLVANLPYNVATPLVCDLLDGVPVIERMLVMVQREAAERFVAAPRTAAYGAVSVKVAYWATAKIVAQVPASVFVPRPNVESALVEITRRTPPATDAHALFALVRAAFGQRRKMLRKSLAGTVAHGTFADAGISPTARPEELDISDWCRLADAHLAAAAR